MNTTPRVLGQNLNPLSLEILTALLSIRSPFVIPGASIELSDVMLAAKIATAPDPLAVDLAPTPRDRALYQGAAHSESFLRGEAQIIATYLGYAFCGGNR